MISQDSFTSEDTHISDYEEFSPTEVDSTMTDEYLMDEVSGCPTIRRLQAVARRYKYRAFFGNEDLEKERARVTQLKLESEQDVERISDLTTYLVNTALERDEAGKQVRTWKMCTCVVGVIAIIYFLAI